MADNRKYYYLKLKENFFDSDSVVLLEDMKDGILYSNILLKLYLKSLKNGGRLQLDEHIPYTAHMIATLTRHQIGTVERALAIFQQLGLVEQLDCGLLYMTDIELMIGQSSTEAERKRAARLENKALLPPDEAVEGFDGYNGDLTGDVAATLGVNCGMSTGRKYQNHAATILRWAADDTAKAAPKQGIPDYTYKEGESL